MHGQTNIKTTQLFGISYDASYMKYIVMKELLNN